MSVTSVQPRFTDEDLGFLRQCMTDSVASLPREMRIGYAEATIELRSSTDRAFLVPHKMWDGKPGDDGLVRWQWLQVAPNTRG
jgi:hypothetical protein